METNKILKEESNILGLQLKVKILEVIWLAYLSHRWV